MRWAVCRGLRGALRSASRTASTKSTTACSFQRGRSVFFRTDHGGSRSPHSPVCAEDFVLNRGRDPRRPVMVNWRLLPLYSDRNLLVVFGPLFACLVHIFLCLSG